VALEIGLWRVDSGAPVGVTQLGRSEGAWRVAGTAAVG
jgi:hypothetical protein